MRRNRAPIPLYLVEFHDNIVDDGSSTAYLKNKSY